MDNKPKMVPFVCPVCHHKTKGTQRADGAITVVCHCCKANIFSKMHKKELLIKAKLN